MYSVSSLYKTRWQRYWAVCKYWFCCDFIQKNLSNSIKNFLCQALGCLTSFVSCCRIDVWIVTFHKIIWNKTIIHCTDTRLILTNISFYLADATDMPTDSKLDISTHAYILVPIHHDDVIKWKHFPRYWPFVRGIHRSPVNSPHKGQWRGALMPSLICVWVNNREADNLRRYRAHYDVAVMLR